MQIVCEASNETNGLTAANQLWLDESLKAGKNVSALEIASLYAALKNREQTLVWLEKAFDDGEQAISQIRFIARYDFVRDDERFKRLVEKIEFKK